LDLDHATVTEAVTDALTEPVQTGQPLSSMATTQRHFPMTLSHRIVQVRA